MHHGIVRGVALPVPRLIQGTRLLQEPAANLALFDAAFEAGCNAFETAIVYNRGGSEAALGEWMALRGVRTRCIVVANGCHPAFEVPRMTPAHLWEDVGASLERLKTDYIDLYLLHRDDPALPVDEIISALNDATARGVIRAFGASNWTHERIQLANDYAARNGLLSFAASSPGLSAVEALDSWPGCVTLHVPRDKAEVEFYKASRMPLLAWSPLAGGFLSGRYTRENVDSLVQPEERQAARFYASEKNFERLDALTDLARDKGISVAQAAIAYVLSLPLDTYAVLGCRTASEFRECYDASSVRFSESELARLHAA